MQFRGEEELKSIFKGSLGGVADFPAPVPAEAGRLEDQRPDEHQRLRRHRQDRRADAPGRPLGSQPGESAKDGCWSRRSRPTCRSPSNTTSNRLAPTWRIASRSPTCMPWLGPSAARAGWKGRIAEDERCPGDMGRRVAEPDLGELPLPKEELRRGIRTGDRPQRDRQRGDLPDHRAFWTAADQPPTAAQGLAGVPGVSTRAEETQPADVRGCGPRGPTGCRAGQVPRATPTSWSTKCRISAWRPCG